MQYKAYFFIAQYNWYSIQNVFISDKHLFAKITLYFSSYGHISIFSMFDIYTCQLTHFEKHNIIRKLKKYEKHGNCHIWKGKNITRDGYGRIRFLFRGSYKTASVHRLQYFLQAGHGLSPEFHVSHLCHTKLCINVNHLSYEPKTTNIKRDECKLNGECHGHRGYKKCIL